jgi:hypothetical protein
MNNGVREVEIRQQKSPAHKSLSNTFSTSTKSQTSLSRIASEERKLPKSVLRDKSNEPGGHVA